MAELLSRDAFRQQVFERDEHTCVVPWCNRDAEDSHHILERKQWTDEGYYLENGASVCEKHHRHAEANHIPPQAFHRWIGAEDPPIPEHFEDIHYNKWGTEDERGERFETRSELREQQDKPCKYPSTPHLPFSPEHDEHGRIDWSYEDLERLADIPIVGTVKLDGSNCSLTHDIVCSRRGAEATHPSFDRIKARHAAISHLIPEHIQIFGENLQARHSLHYGCQGCCEPRNQGPPLEDVFYVFGVFDHRYQLWLSWDETIDWARRLGFPVAPDVLGGTPRLAAWELAEQLPRIFQWTVEKGHEGIVVRSRYPFHYGQATRYVAKAVRENHVQTDEHWKQGPIVENKVRTDG